MQLNNVEVRRYEMISVPYSNGSTQSKINLPDQPNLRSVKVHGIDLVYSEYDYYGKVNKNYDGNSIQNMFLTLYYGGTEGIFQMPLGEISTIQSAGYTYLPTQFNNNGILALNGQVITWTKSYLSFSNSFTPIALNCVFVIGVYYSL